jgi:serine phosphatase RsbU (regulator of sigma subunit)
LFKEEQQQRQIAESLREVTSILNSSLDQKTVLAEILEQLGRVVAHHGAAIFLKQQTNLVVHDAIGVGKPYIGTTIAIASSDPVAQVFHKKQPLIIENTLAHPDWTVWTDPDASDVVHSWVGVPLSIGDKAIGVLTVDHLTIKAYRSEDVQIVQIFADQAAMAIQNSQLFSAIQQANQRIRDELVLAQQIQFGLLPPATPKWPELELICYTHPMEEVGGDFYTYHQFESRQKYAFAVGDVSGKGVSAALLMATCLSRFEATLNHDFTLTERLAYLDKAIEPYTKPRGQNCAMCYVEIEVKNQGNDFLLHMANAGCIPPYLKRTNGEIEFHEISGFALGQGLEDKLEYQQLTLKLSKGDIIILVSDGVIEAKNSTGDMLGFTKFEQIVAAGPVTSAAEMMAHLQSEVTGFMGNANPHDDLTLIVVHV